MYLSCSLHVWCVPRMFTLWLVTCVLTLWCTSTCDWAAPNIIYVGNQGLRTTGMCHVCCKAIQFTLTKCLMTHKVAVMKLESEHISTHIGIQFFVDNEQILAKFDMHPCEWHIFDKRYISNIKSKDNCLCTPLDIASSRAYFHFYEARTEPTVRGTKINESKWSTIIVIVKVDVEAVPVPPSSWGVTTSCPSRTCPIIQSVYCTEWLSIQVECSKWVSRSNTSKSLIDIDHWQIQHGIVYTACRS